MKRMVLAAAALADGFTAAAPSAAFAQDHYRGGHHARYDHGGDNQDYHSQPRWAVIPMGHGAIISSGRITAMPAATIGAATPATDMMVASMTSMATISATVVGTIDRMAVGSGLAETRLSALSEQAPCSASWPNVARLRYRHPPIGIDPSDLVARRFTRLRPRAAIVNDERRVMSMNSTEAATVRCEARRS
jgi:hypothetical protein